MKKIRFVLTLNGEFSNAKKNHYSFNINLGM
jgi:hypothetical protein